MLNELMDAKNDTVIHITSCSRFLVLKDISNYRGFNKFVF